MIPVSLKLSNFTSYGKSVPELDFTKFHLAAISGPNGAGKSSLLDAITWCLWGTSRLGDSTDALVHLGQKEMRVEFSFELDGHIFTVKRSRVLKGVGLTSLEFLSGLHSLTEGTIKITQQKIIDTLHLSYETFTNSSYLRQGHADEFTTKGPTDRKKILADILGLSHYDLLEEKAKTKIKEIQANLKLLEYQILELEVELTYKEEGLEKKKSAEEELIKLEEQITNLEAELKLLRNERETLNLASEQRLKLEQSYLQNKKELEEIILQGKSRTENISQLTGQLDKLKGIEEKLKQYKNLQLEKEKMDKMKQKRLETEKLLSEIQNKINLKKQKQDQIKNELQKINLQLEKTQKPGAKCPTCNQEIDQDKKQYVYKILTEQKETLSKELGGITYLKEAGELAKLSTNLKNLFFDSQKYQNINTQLLDLDKLQQQKEQKLQTQATLKTEERVVLEMRSLYQNKNKQVLQQKQELQKSPDYSDKLKYTNQEIIKAESQLSEIRSMEKEARSTLGQITELISRTAQLEKTKKQKLKEQTSLQKEGGVFEELSLAFGKKGIQAMIIETAIPEIEDEANRLLEKLTEGRMKIKLETQRETKTHRRVSEQTKAPGIIETLDIIISDEVGERPYEGYSGGEQFRVNFAIRLALSKLLTHRAGAKLQFLVIDEGFGTQDTQGKSRIVEVLNAIKDDFEKILIITHLEELKDEFPTRIEVSKGTSGSTFVVIGD